MVEFLAEEIPEGTLGEISAEITSEISYVIHGWIIDDIPDNIFKEFLIRLFIEF